MSGLFQFNVLFVMGRKCHPNVTPINCERSELLICKVHQFGLGCIKNCVC